MTTAGGVSQVNVAEDFALEKVPEDARRDWLQISWNTTGIVTTLVQLFIGALITFVCGIKIALIGGIIVTLIGGGLGAALGVVASRTGFSSTVIARSFGFGIKGSAIASAIFAFMIIGFIAAENMLLYNGFLFFFGLTDTFVARILILGLMTVAWIGLTAWGFGLVTRVSSVMVIGFVALLIFMLIRIAAMSGQSALDMFVFDSQLSADRLQAMGALDDTGKIAFAVNLLIGSAGALALVNADLGRYARSSGDIIAAAFIGNIVMDIGMLIAGGVVMHAGLPILAKYYGAHSGTAVSNTASLGFESPDQIAATFIIFGGALGALLMVLAQAKAQVLNTYSSSLSLANLADALIGWKPGRIAFVVMANLLSFLFLTGNMIIWFNSFLTVLGILTTCVASLMLSDYFVVAPALKRRALSSGGAELLNWSGIISLVLGFFVSHHLLATIVPIEVFSAFVTSLVAYPILRLFILAPSPKALLSE